MGTNNSKPDAASPISPDFASSPTATTDTVPTRRPLTRRGSIQVPPSSKTAPAAPAATLQSAVGESSSTSRSRASLSHSRGRPQTVGIATPKAQSRGRKDMGNKPSSEKHAGAGHGLSQTSSNRSSSPSYKTARIRAPILTNLDGEREQPAPLVQTEASSPPPTPYALPPSQWIHPPRLPLPIQEELLSPGSPIISPADHAKDADQIDSDGSLGRKGSVLSSTTVDDDELGEDEMFREGDTPSAKPAVDTLIEWKQGGKKVYVTGTFANWNKKFKLHEYGPSKDPKALSAIIPLPPGTHHVTFLVDGGMRTASHMPTAVDWTNALVNYIEVSPTDSKAKDTSSKAHKTPTSGAQTPTVQPTPELRPVSGSAAAAAVTGPASAPLTHPSTSTARRTSSPASKATTKKAPTSTQYHRVIPKFLLDLDSPEASSRYLRASAVTSTQPAPPSLPMFLSKSILNGATPMKDDSSVLVLPNHTVLNHLATSSIKTGVLATSATTRYKKKYVTTILYKPTSEVGG